MGWTGVLPEKIENLGITFAAPARRALLWVFLAVVVYYTLAFIFYAFSDFLTYRYAVHRGREELRKEYGREDADRIESSLNAARAGPVNTPWPLARYVTWASLFRGIFDFAIPLAVAGVAIGFLWYAIAHVSTPVPPSAPDLGL